MVDKVEIEIKLPLNNADALKKSLEKTGQFKYEARQIDRYYNAADRDFLATPDNVDEWLRLRTSNGKHSINYKCWYPHDQQKKTHCDEYETEVGELDHMELIFKALNLKPMIVVDKTRRVYMVDDVEVSIDTVADLGDFIELEYKGNLTDIAAAREVLFQVLKKIGADVGEIDYRGYPHLLLKKKGLI